MNPIKLAKNKNRKLIKCMSQHDTDFTSMMQFNDFPTAFKHCKNSMLDLIGNNKYIYIGATNCPLSQCNQTLLEKGMFKTRILCEVPNKQQAKKLNDALIIYFKNYKKLIDKITIEKNGNLNFDGDSGIVDGTNFIYVLSD